MRTEGSYGQDPEGAYQEVQDRTLMREIQLLGALIAEVEGHARHLSPEELDQVLKCAEAAIRPTTGPPEQAGPEEAEGLG